MRAKRQVLREAVVVRILQHNRRIYRNQMPKVHKLGEEARVANVVRAVPAAMRL